MGNKLVDVDRRTLELALLVELVQVVHAGGRLLGDAANLGQVLRVLVVDEGGEVAPVVEDHVARLVVLERAQGLLD
jgi:hypothetical protein